MIARDHRAALKAVADAPGLDPRLPAMLAASAAGHAHLCPRQVLGIRMGILAGRLLGLDVPRSDKRLLVIAETDGCAVDGLIAATGCSVGRRTLRIEDYGKVAAAFVDCRTGAAVRIVPSQASRLFASVYAPGESDRWRAQLRGYQQMPDHLLLSWRWVALRASVAALLSQAGRRTRCRDCGEEIINEREVIREGAVLCRACAGASYYVPRPAGWTADIDAETGAT